MHRRGGEREREWQGWGKRGITKITDTGDVGSGQRDGQKRCKGRLDGLKTDGTKDGS